MAGPGADVVIIGAGIQGLYSAYALTTLGVSRVVVVEAEHAGAGSSSRSASMVMLQRENTSKIALSVYSYLCYMRFADEFGVDPYFRRCGFMSVATESVAQIVLKRAAVRRSLGIPTDILSPQQVAEFVPAVNVSDITLGVYGPDDGHIRVSLVVNALKEACQRAGVAVREEIAATDIILRSGRVVSVTTTAGEIPCGTVINAAGARAAEVASWVGLNLPVDNRRRTIFLTGPIPGVRPDAPMVEDAEEECYWRPEGDGILVGLGKDENAEVSQVVDADVLARAQTFARHRFPGLGRLEPLKGWSGIRPLTPDLLPIVGRVSGIEGYVNCCGWGGEGVQHAPAGGRMAAEAVVFGEPRSLEGLAYVAERFPQIAADHG